MEVTNESQGFTISGGAGLRRGFWGRFRGLMLSGRRDVVLDAGFDDTRASTIHMMFMLYPIDVVWVASDMTVVDVGRGIPPFNPMKPATWRLYKPRRPARYVVELGAGDAGGTAEGDKIKFK